MEDQTFSTWSQGQLTFKPGQLNGISTDFDLVYEQIMKDYDLPSKNAAKNLLSDMDLHLIIQVQHQLI